MNETPTPRTDAQEFIPVHESGHFPPYPTVSSAFSRQLERENQTFRNAQKACEYCDAPRVDRIAELERELEQERQDRKQADLDTIRALGERNDAREQLAETAKDYLCLAELLDGHDATECRANLEKLKADLSAERALADRLAAKLQDIEESADDDELGSADFRKCCRYDIPKALAAWKASRDPNNLEGPGPSEEQRRENARAIQALSVPERHALMFGKTETKDD